jgi:hypothetical protein
VVASCEASQVVLGVANVIQAVHQDNPFYEVYMATNQKIGRNAGNGQFTTVKQAQQYPKTHVVETIKHQPQSSPQSSKKR